MGMIGAKWVFEFGAGIYDWLTTQETWRAHCRTLTDHFPQRPEGRPLDVLDVGTGPAMSAIGIVDRMPDARVTAVDYSERMLRRAERNVRREGYPISLLHADASQLPFATASFDVVTAHSFIYLVPQRERVLAELWRVLRPGGRCVFLEPHEHAPRVAWRQLGGDVRYKLSMVSWRVASRQAGRFSEASLRDLLVQSAFTDVTVQPTLGGLGLLASGVRA